MEEMKQRLKQKNGVQGIVRHCERYDKIRTFQRLKWTDLREINEQELQQKEGVM